MKLVQVLALGASLLTLQAPAPAAGTGSAYVSAVVMGTCKVIAPPGLLDFGTIDPSSSSSVTATTAFSIQCTKRTVSTAASDDGGLNFSGTKRMRHSANATATLPYTLQYSGDAGFIGQGFGSAAAAQTVSVTGIITPAQFQNALVTAAGQAYRDTVTITVNP